MICLDILKHYWRHICLTRPRRFVTFYTYKRLRNTLTYLLTYLLTQGSPPTAQRDVWHVPSNDCCQGVAVWCLPVRALVWHVTPEDFIYLWFCDTELQCHRFVGLQLQNYSTGPAMQFRANNYCKTCFVTSRAEWQCRSHFMNHILPCVALQDSQSSCGAEGLG